MKKQIYTALLISSISLTPVVATDGALVETTNFMQQDFDYSDGLSIAECTQTKLARLNAKRIQAASRDLRTMMKRVRNWSFGVTGSSLLVVGAVLYWAAHNQEKVLKIGEIDTDDYSPNAARRMRYALAKRQYQQGRWTEAAKQNFSLVFAAGAAGFALSTLKPLATAISERFKDAIELWWYGYDAWFAREQQQFDKEFKSLRNSLHQARAVQSRYEQQRNMRMSREELPETYYRDEIMILYQRNLARIERMIALMYLIAPKSNHAEIADNVHKIALVIHSFASKLEEDLNVNSRGFLTHYSNDTLDLFHKLYEQLRPLFANFQVFWRY